MVYESPGFVTTRMITLMINEAMHFFARGRGFGGGYR